MKSVKTATTHNDLRQTDKAEDDRSRLSSMAEAIAPIFRTGDAVIGSRAVLPVKIEPAQLRPIAFRVFTKKYNLTLKSDALKLLATHVGVRCGQTWRSTCEPVLDEIAKSWSRTQDLEPIVGEAGLAPIIKALEVAHVPRPATLAREDTMMLDATAPTPSTETTDPRRYLTYIDAFEQPVYNYSPVRQTFQHETKKPSMLADAVMKPRLWAERYHFLRARIMRHESFQAPSFHNQSGTFHKLTQIKNLLGRQGKSFMIFGLLTIGVDAHYYLEDADDSVRLDFTGASCGGGWFCPGCFVLVDGTYTEEEIFHVSVMGLPPPESRDQTKEVYAGLDMLETGIERSQERHLARAEQSYTGSRIVFCSDCHLDDPRAIKAIKTMLASYEILTIGELPLAIVMIGNFISHPHHTNGFSSAYKESWDTLAATLEAFPKLCASAKFVFVPGSNDPWSIGGITVLPRRSIPKTFLNRISRACKDVVYSSNPCRLSYFTQEIVICRDDMVERLRRNNVTMKRPHLPPSLSNEAGTAPDSEEMEDDEVLMHNDAQETQEDTQAQVFLTPASRPHRPSPPSDPTMPPPTEQAPSTSSVPAEEVTGRTVIRTLIDQSHLSPFQISTRPIAWSHSSSLRLFPSPTVLVLADPAVPAYTTSYAGVRGLNPGSIVFEKHARWTEYLPASKTATLKSAYIQ